jgi:H+/gluconate symporter-like permease
MTSNTNASHNAVAAYTKNVTWIDTSPEPTPIPTPDNNSSSSDWPIYVGVSVGVVVLAVIGFIIFKKIQKRKQDNYERV